MLNLLFVHQNFPGQFKHLAPQLAAAGAGGLVVGSATAPVEEVIDNQKNGQKNGLLVDFADVGALTDTVVDCLARPTRHAALRTAARRTAVERYDLATVCLPQQVKLIEALGLKGQGRAR